MTPDEKYSRRNMQNFNEQVQTPLCQKEKAVSGFFIEFLKCALNFEHFERKLIILALSFPKLLTPKEVVT